MTQRSSSRSMPSWVQRQQQTHRNLRGRRSISPRSGGQRSSRSMVSVCTVAPYVIQDHPQARSSPHPITEPDAVTLMPACHACR